MEKIKFALDENEIVEFDVLEQTTVAGINYILVTDCEEGDGDALILKHLSAQVEEEANYIIVEDDEELKSIAHIFKNLLEDIDLL